MELSGKAVLTWLALAGCVFGVYSCNTSQWWTAREEAEDRANAAANLAAETPHEIAHDADGCKTMQFRRGDIGSYHWHTYTSCPGSRTTHEDAWEETRRNGKQTITERKTAVVVTQ